MNLPREVLAFCRPKWENNTLSQNNPLETINCCLNSCQDTVDYCYQNCTPKTEKCLEKCRDLVLDCKNSCYDLPSETLASIQICMENEDCGTFPDIDHTCFQKNKQKIINCCYDKTKNNNCKDILNSIQNKNFNVRYYAPDIIFTPPKKVFQYGFWIFCLLLSILTIYLIRN
jgi:hypothetical protein